MSRPWCRRWWWALVLGGVSLLFGVGGTVYAIASGRLFLHSLPDPLRVHVLSGLYDPIALAANPEEARARYRILIDRVGVEGLIQLHKLNFNSPYTEIALGLSGDAEALTCLREQAMQDAWSDKKHMAIWGLVGSGAVGQDELFRIYMTTHDQWKWPIANAVFESGNHDYESVVTHYAEAVFDDNQDDQNIRRRLDAYLGGRRARSQAGPDR